VGHSFAYVAHFVFLRDVWIRTQKAAAASGCASTNLATHLPPFRVIGFQGKPKITLKQSDLEGLPT
jgi:hypothetical protein